MRALKFSRVCILAVACLTLVYARGSALEFGFTGPETFPIDDFISQLRAADLDGDGLTDLIVANNSRSRITLLYNQTGQTNQPASKSTRREDINKLPADARFRVDSLASEKRIAGLVVTDLNGDGRPDIAYYGEPKELVIHYNAGSNSWALPKTWPIQDGLLTPNALTVGDLNGDGRADLLLLGEKNLYWLPQTADRGLAEPQVLPYSEAAKSVQALDIDGDGRQDLLLVDWDNASPFRVRFQNSSGQLGPELHFTVPPIRAYMADQLDGVGRTELVTIARNSGRAQVSHFLPKPAEPLLGPLKLGQVNLLPLSRTSQATRGFAWTDVNGDKLADFIVAEPESGQIRVTLQQPNGSFAQAFVLPSLTGVSDLAAEPGAGEGPARLYLLSAEERQVGVMTFDGRGVAPFPETVPLPGKPIALATGRLTRDAPATLAVILDVDGERSFWWRQGDEPPRTLKLNASFRSNPARMAFHDANQDGLADILILIPYEKMKILLQTEPGQFQELDLAPPGGVVEQSWFGSADLDGDGHEELLLAQRNFVRAVLLESPGGADGLDWRFRVKDQINGASSRSRILAAAALPLPGSASPALFLLDAEQKALTLCERREEGIWQIVRNIPLAFAQFTSIQPLALGGAQPNSVAFFGPTAAAWLPLQGETWGLVELDGYETELDNGRLNEVVSGDFNNDQRKELVFLEATRGFIELVFFTADSTLAPATRWQVFEQRTFRGRRAAGPEPREALVADLTGDGKQDLAVLVHDRILVYPQE